MRALHLSLLALTALTIAACGGTSNKFSRAGLAEDAKSQLVGKPKDEILACMGVPAKTASLSDVEVWTYFSGGETTSAGIIQGQSTGSGIFGTSIARSRSRYCEVDVVLSEDRVTRLNYRGPTGGIVTEGEQCAFAVASCLEE